MNQCKLLTIDLAKNVFQVYAEDRYGRKICNRKVKRNRLIETVVQLQPQTVVTEACFTSHYWARQLQAMGIKVRLLPAQHVKPFVKGNKNDHHDALAICEASKRSGIHFVPVKTIDQQDIQSLHRIRERLIKNRTALSNQTRGLLLEYGETVTRGFRAVRDALPLIIESAGNELTLTMRSTFLELLKELVEISTKIETVERSIERLASEQQTYDALLDIPGIGKLGASALISRIGNGAQFNSARAMAAWLGLVPRHEASGETMKMKGISKNGDRYLRTLLVHGGRAVVCAMKDRDHPLKRFADRVAERRGMKIACVAVAHKLARIIWAMLRNGSRYQPDFALARG